MALSSDNTQQPVQQQPTTYIRYRCDKGYCVEFVTTDPSQGFASCAAAGCAGTTQLYERYLCNAGSTGRPTLIITEDPNEGVTTQAELGYCPGDLIYRRYACGIAPGAGNATCNALYVEADLQTYEYPSPSACAEHCQEIYYWCLNGQQYIQHDSPGEGATGPFNTAQDCSAGNCPYVAHTLTVTRTGETLILTLAPQGVTGSGGTLNVSNGWTIILHHTLNNGALGDLTPTLVGGMLHFETPFAVGEHHFEASYSKSNCPIHIAEANYVPDDFTCAPTVAFNLPTEDAALKSYVRVRVTVADPNEVTEPCDGNYNRPCNHESDGPGLQLFLSEYLLPTTWKQISGTPLNGVWETVFDTRDYSQGAHDLTISVRGVGCCRVMTTRTVTLANTLQGGVFYRDTRASAPDGYVIGDAIVGIETRALEENTSRRYWEQWGVRSGTALDGPYKEEDWPKHIPVLPELGAQWPAQGKRFARSTYSAHPTFQAPLDQHVRFRRKWTPQFHLACFDLNAEKVTKIRQLKAGSHLVLTQNPSRVWVYENDVLTQKADFSINATGDVRGASFYAPTASDAAMVGGKIYVVVPSSDDLPKGELFAFDPDDADYSMVYTPRHESRVPAFVEAVGGLPLVLFVGDSDTRAYVLTFTAPRPVWLLEEVATMTSIDGDTLFIGCGHKLYSTKGTDAPALLHEFDANVTAASAGFVGLSNGEVWKKTDTGYVLAFTRQGGAAVGGVTSWTGGTISEAQTEDARGVAVGLGDWMSGERSDGTWFDERELTVPMDLAPKTVAQVLSFGHYSVDVTPASSGTDATSGDAATTTERDERLLMGTASSGLFFVYQRSNLSEADGAIPVSHDAVPRLFPFYRRG